MASPLFKAAAAALQQQTLQEFRGTLVGQLWGQARQAYSRGYDRAEAFQRVLEAHRGLDPQRALGDLVNTDWGGFVSGVAKYARGGGASADALRTFLNWLGPVGKVLAAVVGEVERPTVGLGLPAELSAAIRLVQAFGYEVLPPPRNTRSPLYPRGLEAARRFMEAARPPHALPEALDDLQEALGGLADIHGPSRGPRDKQRDEFGQSRTPDGGGDVTVSGGFGPPIHVPPNHPLATGQFFSGFNSSNVHSYAYNRQEATLYVRFLDTLRGGERSGPGPLYAYYMVEPELFLALHDAASKGNWVWDALRIRGTVAGKQKDYSLVGIARNYVPRMAQMTEQGEQFGPRTILWKGEWLRNTLKPELVRAYKPVGGVPSNMRHLFGLD